MKLKNMIRSVIYLIFILWLETIYLYLYFKKSIIHIHTYYELFTLLKGITVHQHTMQVLSIKIYVCSGLSSNGCVCVCVCGGGRWGSM